MKLAFNIDGLIEDSVILNNVESLSNGEEVFFFSSSIEKAQEKANQLGVSATPVLLTENPDETVKELGVDIYLNL